MKYCVINVVFKKLVCFLLVFLSTFFKPFGFLLLGGREGVASD